MKIPIRTAAKAFRLVSNARADGDARVRVAIFVDPGAARGLVDAVRRLFVPRTTSASVRVGLLDGAAKVDEGCDLVVIIAAGSEDLPDRVFPLALQGVPVAVVARSASEVPFMHEDVPALGLIFAGDDGRLEHELAAWILGRTAKVAAFSSAFDFLRAVASERSIASAAVSNALAGALPTGSGADFPVMAFAQTRMAIELAGIHGKPLTFERAYEIAPMLIAALGLRRAARSIAPKLGPAAFAGRAFIAGGGTALMGAVLCFIYRRDLDYTMFNSALSRAISVALNAVGSRPDAGASGSRGARGTDAAGRTRSGFPSTSPADR